MIAKRLSEMKLMDNAHNVDARNLYNTNEAMITVITLNPGQSLKRHITPVDVAFYVLDGSGVVEVGDEKMDCWYNESSGPLRFMVVKAPKPTKKTVFIGN